MRSASTAARVLWVTITTARPDSGPSPQEVQDQLFVELVYLARRLVREQEWWVVGKGHG